MKTKPQQNQASAITSVLPFCNFGCGYDVDAIFSSTWFPCSVKGLGMVCHQTPIIMKCSWEGDQSVCHLSANGCRCTEVRLQNFCDNCVSFSNCPTSESPVKRPEIITSWRDSTLNPPLEINLKRKKKCHQ